MYYMNEDFFCIFYLKYLLKIYLKYFLSSYFNTSYQVITFNNLGKAPRCKNIITCHTVYALYYVTLYRKLKFNE